MFLTDHKIHPNTDAFIATLGSIFAVPVPRMPFGFSVFPVNPPVWSLFLEVILSVAFGIFLCRLTTLSLAAVAVVAGVVMRIGEFPWLGDGFLWASLGGFPTALTAFVFGMLLSRWRRVGRLRDIRAPFWLPAVLVAAVTLFPRSWGGWPSGWPADVSFYVVFPLVIVLGWSEAGHGRAVRWLGELSYPLYVLHWPVLAVCVPILGRRVGLPASTVIGCAASIAVAWLALTFYDEPIRAWLMTRLVRSRSEGPRVQAVNLAN